MQDIISLWVTQILQTYGDKPSSDNAPIVEGEIDDLVGGPIFLALYPYFRCVLSLSFFLKERWTTGFRAARVDGSCAGSRSTAASFFGLDVAEVPFFLVTSFFATRFAVTTSVTLGSLRDDPKDMPPVGDRRAATGDPLAFVFGDPGECAG